MHFASNLCAVAAGNWLHLPSEKRIQVRLSVMSASLSNVGRTMKRKPAHRCLAVVAVCGMLIGGMPAGAGAQGITGQQADEMLKELRAIHALLQKAAQPPAAPTGPPPDAPVKLERVTGYILGRPDAPLTMVEFTDLQCPYCSRFATQTFDAIKKGWIDTGRLRFLSRDFPLPMHPEAQRAARASRCAGEQGRFWELRTDLVRNAERLSPAFITERAAALKLDIKAFTACVESTRFDAEIAQDQRDGSAAGIQGTPSFIVGRTGPQGLDGILIVGAQPYDTFDQKLKELLASAGSPKP